MLPDPKSTKRTFTPGPWSATVDLFRPPKVFVHAPDSFAVCRVMTAHYHAETARANAHLIAAAPSMLIALKQIKEHCPTDPDVTRQFNVAWALLEAAIAKAEGR
jgi:hypothetical protein